MAIFLTKDSRILVQGMTGSEGRKHTQRMLRSGSQVVAGVTPGKGGQSVDFDGVTLPVFSAVSEAMAETAALANRGGTNTTETSAPVSFTASATLPKTGMLVSLPASTIWPPLPGVPPATIDVDLRE